MFTKLIEWHTLDASKLNRDSIVLDLGANYGRFAQKIIQTFGCEVHSVEASPEIYDGLKNIAGIKSYNYAIAGKNGPVTLYLSENKLAANIVGSSPGDTGNVEVDGIDLDSFIKMLGVSHVDLLKIDIEGSEIAMFDACSDVTLKSIGQITVEFHDFVGLVKHSDVKRVLKRLERLGFTAIRMSRIGHQDTWLINRAIYPTPMFKILFIRYFERGWRGATRIARKAILGRRWADGV